MSTQLVLNKYNTNYEALRLADSTALAFKCWQNFIKAIYYELMNYQADDGAHLRGYKHRSAIQAQTKSEEQGPLKLTTLAPQVGYSKPKRPN